MLEHARDDAADAERRLDDVGHELALRHALALHRDLDHVLGDGPGLGAVGGGDGGGAGGSEAGEPGHGLLAVLLQLKHQIAPGRRGQMEADREGEFEMVRAWQRRQWHRQQHAADE